MRRVVLMALAVAVATVSSSFAYAGRAESTPEETAAAGAPGVGDVMGPAGATDEAVCRFDTGTGKLIQNSVVGLSDAGAFTGVTDIALDTISSDSGTTVAVTLGTDAGDDFTVGGALIVAEGDAAGHVAITPNSGFFGVNKAVPVAALDVVGDAALTGDVAVNGGDVTSTTSLTMTPAGSADFTIDLNDGTAHDVNVLLSANAASELAVTKPNVTGLGISTVSVNNSINPSVATGYGFKTGTVTESKAGVFFQRDGSDLNHRGDLIVAMDAGADVGPVALTDEVARFAYSTGVLELQTGLAMNELAAAPFATEAAHGSIWVRNDVPNVLVFTDDAGTDTVLGVTGGDVTGPAGATVTGIPTLDATGKILTDSTVTLTATDMTFPGAGTIDTGASTLSLVGSSGLVLQPNDGDVDITVSTGDQLNITLGSANGDDLVLTDGSNTIFVVDGQKDRVGINVPIPSFPLDVAGASGTLIGAQALGADADPSTVRLRKTRNTVVDVHTAVLAADGVGRVDMEGSNGSSFFAGARIEAAATENWGVGANGTEIIFQTTADTTSTRLTRMTIEQSGDVTLTSDLAVNGDDITADGTLVLTGATGATLAATAGDVTVNLAGAAGEDFIVDTTTLVVESDNDRVGIGEAAPSEKLEVVGNIRIDAVGSGFFAVDRAANTNFNGLQLSTADVDSWTIGHRNDSTEDLHFFNETNPAGAPDPFDALKIADETGQMTHAPRGFSTTGATEDGLDLTFADTGVVTTGTDTTNGVDLNVTRTGATGGTINTFGIDLDVLADAAGAGTSTATGLDISVSGADTNYALVTSGGNVGIGTATPAVPLDVVGDISTTGDIAVNGDDITADGTLVVTGATGATLTATAGDVTINLGSASGEDFIVDTNTFVVESDSNQVGIGLTNPSESLEVSGGNVLVAAGTGDNYFMVDRDGVNDGPIGLQFLTGGSPAWTVGPQADTSDDIHFFNENLGNAALLLDAEQNAATLLSEESSSLAATLKGITSTTTHNGNIASGTDVTQGIDLNVTRGGTPTGGTLTTHGIDMDVVAGTGGTQTAIGLDIAVSGADTNYAMVTTGGNVGFGTATPDATALLDMASTTQGLLIPRMTGAQETTYLGTSPPDGSIWYESDLDQVSTRAGGATVRLGSGTGDVTGPAGGVVDNEIVAYSGTGGKNIKSSGGATLSATTMTFPGAGTVTSTGADMTVSAPTGSDVAVTMGTAAGDDFTVQTDTLVVEGDNDRVGINNAAPLFTVDASFINASGTAASETGFRLVSADTGAVAAGTDTTRGLFVDTIRTGAIGGTINTTGLDVDVLGDGGGTSTVTGAHISVSGADTNYALITSGGNVGLGVAAPAVPLDVSGNIATTGDVAVNGGNITSTGALSIDPTTSLTLAPASTNDLIVTLAGASGDMLVNTDVFAIDSTDGAVGMGTAAPSTMLNLQTDDSDTGVLGTGAAIRVEHYSTTGTEIPDLQFRKSGSATKGGVGAVDTGDTLGRVLFQGMDGVGPVSGAFVQAKPTETYVNATADYGTEMEFAVTPNGGSGPGVVMTIEEDSTVKAPVFHATTELELPERNGARLRLYSEFRDTTTSCTAACATGGKNAVCVAVHPASESCGSTTVTDRYCLCYDAD